jgi:hypothetical protein
MRCEITRPEYLMIRNGVVDGGKGREEEVHFFCDEEKGENRDWSQVVM